MAAVRVAALNAGPRAPAIKLGMNCVPWFVVEGNPTLGGNGPKDPLPRSLVKSYDPGAGDPATIGRCQRLEISAPPTNRSLPD